MKIYFAGSIRGGRQDADWYYKLIKEIKKYGEVLTEHVGSDDLNEELSDYGIYKRDMDWLEDSDALICEVTRPSHGVGYEIGQAVAMNKKVYCLYREDGDSSISAMLNGSPAVECYKYNSLDEATKIIENILTGE